MRMPLMIAAATLTLFACGPQDLDPQPGADAVAGDEPAFDTTVEQELVTNCTPRSTRSDGFFQPAVPPLFHLKS